MSGIRAQHNSLMAHDPSSVLVYCGRMRAPRVSIICAIFNGSRFLGEAVESVLRQDFTDYELLLIDDGSSDGSSEIARSYADRLPDRIRYLEHPSHVNRGASPTRNLGLRHASGELIAFIDSDDVWRPTKLSEQVRIMDENPETGILCGTVNYWSSWAGGKDRLVPTGVNLDRSSEPIRTLLDIYPLGDAHAACPSDVMVRRQILDEQPFEEAFVGPAQIYEDQVFFVKAYLSAPALFSSRVWIDYRQHPDSCVSVVVRDGLYPAIRRDFLDWFEGYLCNRDVPGKNALLRAIRRARWELDHPFVGAIARRARRMLSPPASAASARARASAQPARP
jgi:glycosyltransferase involved in cell wall biosynthesis